MDTATGLSLPNGNEFDATLDYKVPEGRFKGFWLRLRAARLEEGGTNDAINDYRVIVRYEIPLL